MPRHRLSWTAVLAGLIAAGACSGSSIPDGKKKVVDCQPTVECACSSGAVAHLQCDLQGNPLGCGCVEKDAGSDLPSRNDLVGDLPREDQVASAPDLVDALVTQDAPMDQTSDAGREVAADSVTDGDAANPGRDAGGDALAEAGPLTAADAVADLAADVPDAMARDLKKYDVAGPDSQAAEGGTCIADPAEWCDGKDNDCDGVIDNGHVCPEPGVANTLPFSDGVYLQGTTSEGLCGTDALQRFWPTKEKTYYYGFNCYADLYQFRPSDWQLFYEATFSGILIDDSTTGTDTLVPTPPCGESVFGKFGFDGAGTMYYMCSGSVRRGNGESVTGASALAAVLADGRMVVTRASPTGSARFELVDPSGTTVSTLDLSKEFVGTLSALPNACTVSGNDAFLLLSRSQGQEPLEMVVYRLTADSKWLLVRRVTTKRSGLANLVISDGTVFVREDDPTSTFGERIVAFPSGGSETIVWREDEAPVVRAHIGDQMLVGPANAQGPSVKPE
jgi:hypothetical protein